MCDLDTSGSRSQAPSNYRVEAVDKRMSIAGTVFSAGDYIVRIGRYFDRDVSDPSGLTFEEWQPITVFSNDDVGKTVNIVKGVVKVNRTTRPEVYWSGEPPEVISKQISKVDSATSGWVDFVGGGRIRNPPAAGDFVVNATELRAVNFSMLPLDRQLPLQQVTVRRSGSQVAGWQRWSVCHRLHCQKDMSWMLALTMKFELSGIVNIE